MGKKMSREVRKKTSYKKYIDYNLITIIIFLLCFGLVMLYSMSSYTASLEFDGNDMYYFKRQLLISLGGFGVMIVVSLIPYRAYVLVAPAFYLFSLGLCVLVQTPLGIESGGARRWLPLPFVGQFQPGEVVKLAMILFVAGMICKKGAQVGKDKYWLKIAGVAFVGLLAVWKLTDNLSTSIIVGGIGIGMLLVALKHGRKIMLIGVAAIPVIWFGLQHWASTAGIDATSNDVDFRIKRVLAWLNPEEYTSNIGYQTQQGLYAIGSGGFWGKGLGNGTQKLSAIPEVQNDMILSAICEELGIFGTALIMILFLILIYRLMFIAQNAPDMYASLIVTGIFIHIALQVIFNIGVITGMIPNTGVTLPFFSYGGTAIVFLMIEMGVALGISNRIQIVEESEESK